MKKTLFLLLALVLTIHTAMAGPDKKKSLLGNENQYRYDIEYVKNAGDGMSVVKVWSYGKSVKEAQPKCKANAIHGVIFKGYSGQGAVQPPLVRDPNAYFEHQDFFDQFFDNGDYLRYVVSEVDGSAETRKTQKKEYKVSMAVTINVKMLRKHLEQAGIIRGLASGF